MNCSIKTIPISKIYNLIKETLFPPSLDQKENETEENIQSRLRGLILMALSNKSGRLLLTTGNKSELAVGYSTIYGDMCGGYNPIKDLYKTRLYQICKWRHGDTVMLWCCDAVMRLTISVRNASTVYFYGRNLFVPVQSHI